MEVMNHERFGQVRTLSIDGVTYFAGRDVAYILGYRKPDSFLNKHVKKSDKKIVALHSLPLSSSSCVRLTAVINQNGVSDLCRASHNPLAEDIKRWLLGENARPNANISSEQPVPHALQLFDDAEYGQFRWVMIDGAVWFVAADMCRILGHTNPTMAIAALDDDEKRKIDENGVTIDPKESVGSVTTPFFHEINVVNEFGLYRLIMMSRKPNAKKFQRKVYHEILPAINKHGFYSVKEPKKTLKPLMPVAVVYAVLFSNMLVKIGYTTDFYRRLKELRKETQCDIAEFVTTPFMPLDDARLLELAVKAKFFAQIVNGEFFYADFPDVKAAITGVDRVAILLAIADRLHNPDEKDRLLLQAAALS